MDEPSSESSKGVRGVVCAARVLCVVLCVVSGILCCVMYVEYWALCVVCRVLCVCYVYYIC